MTAVRVFGPAQLVQTGVDAHGQTWDTWRVFVGGHGTMLLILRGVNDDWPDPVKATWELRRRAMLTGQCPECRVRPQLEDGPRGRPRLTLIHDEDCVGNERSALIALGEWAAGEGD